VSKPMLSRDHEGALHVLHVKQIIISCSSRTSTTFVEVVGRLAVQLAPMNSALSRLDYTVYANLPAVTLAPLQSWNTYGTGDLLVFLTALHYWKS